MCAFTVYMCSQISFFAMYAVAYAESFRGGPKFWHNRVTSQINLGSAESTIIIGWSGGMPQKNFAKLHLKIRIFVPVKSEASRKPKKRSHSGGYSNPGARGKNFQKLMFSRKKRGGFDFVFHFFLPTSC